MSNGMIGEPYDFDATNACIDGFVRDIDALQGALRLACEHIAAYGSCPHDEHYYEGMEADCAERCSPDVDYAECWRRYFEEAAR